MPLLLLFRLVFTLRQAERIQQVHETKLFDPKE